MTAQAITALFAALGVVAAAVVSAISASVALLWRKIGELERRAVRMETRERETWWWARSIADLYYRYRRQDAPDLPPPPEHREDDPA